MNINFRDQNENVIAWINLNQKEFEMITKMNMPSAVGLTK